MLKIIEMSNRGRNHNEDYFTFSGDDLYTYDEYEDECDCEYDDDCDCEDEVVFVADNKIYQDENGYYIRIPISDEDVEYYRQLDIEHTKAYERLMREYKNSLNEAYVVKADEKKKKPTFLEIYKGREDIEEYCRDANIPLSEFNMKVIIGKDVDCRYLFAGLHNFNQEVVLPKKCKSALGLFYDCPNFNNGGAKFIIPNGVTDCTAMFKNCISLEVPVKIGSGVEDTSAMFSNCERFNQAVKLPTKLARCSDMFIYCSSFNKSITIPANVVECDGMFAFCDSFNSNVTVKAKKANMQAMFKECTSMKSNITFTSSSANGELSKGMFYNCPNITDDNIICKSVKGNLGVISDKVHKVMVKTKTECGVFGGTY